MRIAEPDHAAPHPYTACPTALLHTSPLRTPPPHTQYRQHSKLPAEAELELRLKQDCYISYFHSLVNMSPFGNQVANSNYLSQS